MSSFLDYFEIVEVVKFDSIIDTEISPLFGHLRSINIVKHRDKRFVILAGRLHFYEGYTLEQIVAPLAFVLSQYEIESVTLTSASGGLSSKVNTGSWYQLDGLISLPMIGSPNFTHSSYIHTETNLAKVVYAYHQGPSLGTIAEYKMLSKLGADLVGMSLYPEAIYMKDKSIEVTWLSLPVCNYYPFAIITEPTHEEVVAIANSAIDQLKDIFINQILEKKS